MGAGSVRHRSTRFGSVLMAAIVVATSAVVIGATARPAAAEVTGPGTNVVSVVPARLLDTRADEKTVDGQAQGAGRVGAAGVVELVVTGRGGVPAGHIGAVVLNVTVIDPGASGYATVYPTGATKPLASNLNYVAGRTVPNLVVAKVGAAGKVSIFTQASAHLAADVTGYVRDEPGFTPVVPARLLDTRVGAQTVDGAQEGDGPVAARDVVTLTVLGRGGVPAVGVGAVMLNVTVTEPVGPGFVTVWPTGTTRPLASNLNMTDQQTVPNLVMAKLGADGTVSIFTTAATHLIADVTAWIADVPGVTSVVPARLLDTRPDEPTVDGQSQSSGVVGANGSIDVVVTGRGDVPVIGTATVLLNVTVVDPAAPGYVTVWPAGTDRPLASNLNYVAGQTVPNLVMAKVGIGGKVSLFTQSAAHLVADVVGYVVEPQSPTWTFEPADWVTTVIVPGHQSNGVYAVSGDGRYAVMPLSQEIGMTNTFDVRVLRADRAARQSQLTSLQVTVAGSPSPEGLLVGNDGRVAIQAAAGGPWTVWEPSVGTMSTVTTCTLPPMGYFVAVPTDATGNTYCRLADGVLIPDVETASPNGRFLVTHTGSTTSMVDAVTGVATPASDAFAGLDGTIASLSDWGDLASWDLYALPNTVAVRQLDGATTTFTAPTGDPNHQSVDLTPSGAALVIVHGDTTIEVEDLAHGPVAVPGTITCGLRAGGSILWATLGSCPAI